MKEYNHNCYEVLKIKVRMLQVPCIFDRLATRADTLTNKSSNTRLLNYFTLQGAVEQRGTISISTGM